LIHLVDEDTNAFNKIMDAFGLPKGNDAEKAARSEAIRNATIYAIQVPYQTMQVAHQSLALIKAMAEIGNPNSVSDAGVGAMCISAAVRGAHLNVKINAQDLLEDAAVKTILTDAVRMEQETIAEEQAILAIVNGKIKA
jgi:glutamate formiminotransferase/formiminotetrahydrofolate cyclodeaminase